MITLKEISQKCNVSIATVSNILNGKSNVSEETKNRVLQVIKETGYKPNYMARSLRATSSKTIGMIVDDITAFGSPKIVEGIMEICEVHGYRAIMSNLRIFSKWLNKEHTHQDFLDLVNSALQEMLSLKVDGIVYVGAYSRMINFLPTDFPVPIVIAYSLSENNQIPAVYIEDVQSAYEMTSHMIQRGHRDIAVITGELSGIHSELRLKGYKKALEEKFMSPILKKYVEKAHEVGGHGGMDFTMDSRMIYCMQNGLPLDMDVYDLAEWCCLAELGSLSMDNNCAAVAFPDFTRGGWQKINGFE